MIFAHERAKDCIFAFADFIFDTISTMQAICCSGLCFTLLNSFQQASLEPGNRTPMVWHQYPKMG